MGRSADAILFWGFTFADSPSEEDYPFLREYYNWGWEYYYASANGVVRPEVDWSIYPRRGSDEEWPYHEVWDAYSSKVDKLKEESACDIHWHGAEGAEQFFVAVKRSVLTASWGDPKIVEEQPIMTMKDVQALKDFCWLMEIEWQAPKWWLASRWW